MKKQDFKVLKTKDLYPFPDNPFHVVEDETLSELAESIKEFGIVTPIITRPKEDGNGYEVIAGQRRGQDDRPAFYPPDGTDTADFADGGRGENRPHTCGGTVLFEERRAGKSLCHDGERRSNALTLTGTADEKHEPERAA